MNIVNNKAYSYMNICKFSVGDEVSLVGKFKLNSSKSKKRLIFPAGTKFTIGQIRLKDGKIPTETLYSGEAYNYTLFDNNGNEIQGVGQYMFDATMIKQHNNLVNDLKRTCVKYRTIILIRTIIRIITLLSAIATLLVGMTVNLLFNEQNEINIGYIIVAMSLFVIFLALTWLEDIKYPRGLEKTLKDRAKSKAMFINCNYDYYNMEVLD